MNNTIFIINFTHPSRNLSSVYKITGNKDFNLDNYFDIQVSLLMIAKYQIYYYGKYVCVCTYDSFTVFSLIVSLTTINVWI